MKYFYQYPEFELEEIIKNSFNHCKKLEGKTILILGGSGALGTIFRHLLLFLNERYFTEPCKIISLDNYIGRNKPKEIAEDKIKYIEHDLTAPLGVKVTNEPIDIICNFSGCAAPSGKSGYSENPYSTMLVSTIGTNQVLELAYHKKATVLHFSSSEVLSHVPDSEISGDEKTLPRIDTMNPRAPYDTTKLYIETVNWVFREKYGVNAKVIRPFNVTCNFRQGDFRVFGAFANQLLQGKKMKVFMPSTQTRSFCWFTDFFSYLIPVLVSGKEMLYHCGNPSEEITIKRLSEIFENVTGLKDHTELIETPDNFKFEPQRRNPNCDKIFNEFGKIKFVSIENQVARFWDWAKQNYKY